MSFNMSVENVLTKYLYAEEGEGQIHSVTNIYKLQCKCFKLSVKYFCLPRQRLVFAGSNEYCNIYLNP